MRPDIASRARTIPCSAARPRRSCSGTPAGKTWRLAQPARDGPVVVVFYLGSTCVACVTHLVELDAAMPRFRERARGCLAVSGDSPRVLAGAARTVRRFQIPLLSDPDHAVSTAYGVWKTDPGRGDGRRRSPARHLHHRPRRLWSAGPTSAIVRSPTSRRCWPSWTGSNGRGQATRQASSPRAGDQRRRRGARNGFTGSPRFAR